MLVQISALLTVAAVLLATPIDARPPSTEEEDSVPSQSSKAPWGKIKNLVVFGDRYFGPVCNCSCDSVSHAYEESVF